MSTMKIYRGIKGWSAGLLSVMLLLAACQPYEQRVPTGAVRMRVQLGGASTLSTRSAALTQSTSYPAGLVTLRASVSGADMATLTQDFPISAGGGEIVDVPAGSNRTLTMQALNDSGAVLYEGQRTGLSITAGGTTDAGALTLQSLPGNAPVTPTVSGVTTPTNAATQTLSGGKPANTALWINGAQAVALDSAITWSTAVSLLPGANTFAVSTRDTWGNASAAVSVSLYRNSAPTAADGSASTLEDTPVVITLSGADVDGDALSYAVVTPPAHGSVTILGNTATYTPVSNYNGADSFTFTASDGMATSASATISLTVTPVNDAPTAADNSASTAEDTAVVITLSGADVDGDTLSYAVVTQPANGSVTILGNQATYTPTANYNGADSFTFTANDGLATSASAMVSLTVTPVNDAPVAANGSATVAEDTPVAITLSGVDVDGGLLSFSLANPPAHGAVTIVGSTATYTPALNYNGADSFTFTANDGLASSAAATVNLTVTPVNDAPVADTGITGTVAEDSSVTITLSGTDVDGDALSYALVTSPAHGSVTILGNQATYTPALNFNGADSFTFTASDGQLQSASATVNFTVTPVNDAPVATATSATMGEDTAVVVTLPATDADGDALSYALVTPPAHGNVTIVGNQATYFPYPNYNGADSFTFTASDGLLTSASAFVSLYVTPVNDPPGATGASISTSEDTVSMAVSPIVDDVDLLYEGDFHIFTIDTQPTKGTVVDIGGQFVYTPYPNTNGFDSFNFTAMDSFGLSVGGTAVVDVAAVNDPPTLSGTPGTALNTLSPYSFTPNLTDVDLANEGDSHTFTLTGASAWLSVNPTTGALSGTPAGDQGGTSNVTLTVTDSWGATASIGPFSLVVTDVTAPAPLANFTARGEFNEMILTWANPADKDLASILLLRKAGSAPTGPADGTATVVNTAGVNLTPGAAASLVDGGVTNGTTYHYAAYALDGTGNISTGVASSDTPQIRWSKVSNGSDFTVGLKNDGTLWSWGYNYYGSLGVGATPAFTATPIQIGVDTNWVSISSGHSHTLALKTDGTLWVWGSHAYGQLGVGALGSQNNPIELMPGTTWREAKAGYIHSLAIRSDGTLWAWGYNLHGILGDGTQLSSTVPIQIGTDTDWVFINGHHYNSMAIKADGTLWGWGYNGSGNIGDGTTVGRLVPTKVGTDSDWGSVSTGYGHTVAIKTNGTLWTWGVDTYGRLGNGPALSPAQLTPAQVGAETTWSMIGTGHNHTIARKIDGTLWGWGLNMYGQLGDGTNTDQFTPVQVGTGTSWANFSAGTEHTVAIKTDGSLWAWGNNGYGELGTGVFSHSTTPTQIGIETTWSTAQGGANHTLAQKAGGTLWSWGNNGSGRLGDGTLSSKQTQVQVGIDTNWAQSSTGWYHSLGIKTDGTLWAWGDNVGGRLGDGTPTSRTTPTAIGIDTNWAVASAGTFHSMAIKMDGTLWAWGANSFGQLGDNTLVGKLAPVQIGIDTNWADVKAGYGNTIALKTDGTLWGWGYNLYGAVGDGTTVDKLIPTQIGVATDWVKIGRGLYHNFAIKLDGTLWGWGINGMGNLGDGTGINRLAPVQIGTATWLVITGGYHFSAGIQSDGTLWMWGANNMGQVGDGTLVNKSVPTQVNSDANWASVGGGLYHTLATKTDGTLWGWGSNIYGELGTGNSWYSTPQPAIGP
ncbi:MAG: Ig-like domain-containing protein [Deltaproteobacteria bacterium]|nr:Ig-like domain-containing protein [Deltaproteobacteria bacterium]